MIAPGNVQILWNMTVAKRTRRPAGQNPNRWDALGDDRTDADDRALVRELAEKKNQK
jgi:hypothetical protein